jgi:putative CocE/NonD family hydrolase
MIRLDRIARTLLLCSLIAPVLVAQNVSTPQPKYPQLPSETPPEFVPATGTFDYVKKEVMIPMRDGVKLHTVIIVPKAAKHAPILLTRTPYEASELTSHAHSSHLEPILQGYDNVTDVIAQDGYIRVVQDVRGKYGSEGDYVMNRPQRGPLNATPVDHSTDTYDTIDWLVKNVPESNGKVGVLGISYDGFTTLTAMFNPHPALKVVVPMNPMVDGWMGDDWFHNGAFRQQTNLAYIYDQEATRKNDEKWWVSHYDEYDEYMAAGSTGAIAKQHGLDQLGFWRKIAEHPSYDSFWQDQAMDKLLAKEPLNLPVMIVDGLWDQEDIYGATAVYTAIEPKDAGNDKVFLVIGPWHHGQQILDGSSLGALKFNSDTALYFRQKILRPFLAQYLIDGAPKAEIAPVTAFETGTNTWRRLSSWPSGCTNGCAPKPTPLYLSTGLKLSFSAPKTSDAPFEEYFSDPAKPVQYRPRPISLGDSAGWKRWLVNDQREVSGRPDVVSFVSDVLTSPVKIAGRPMVNLVASTSGSDSDWVVKVIDLYPDEVANQPEMGGYQLMVSADIFRGRYRESLSTPKAITPDKPLVYRFALPNANHVFLPGHRMMVQIQSTWFPLYDRNPQTFVQNIFFANPGDYRKAVQRIYHTPDAASFVELPVVEAK